MTLLVIKPKFLLVLICAIDSLTAMSQTRNCLIMMDHLETSDTLLLGGDEEIFLGIKPL